MQRRRKASIAPRKRPGPTGGKRDRNRHDQVRRLTDAALRLFLAEGTAAVTIDQIVVEAKMAKGSFYRYARDKADVVEQIMAPLVDEITAVLDRCERTLHGARRDTLAAVYLELATDLSLVLGRHAPRVLLYLQEVRAPSPPTRTFHELSDQLVSRAIVLTRIARDHGLIRAVDLDVVAWTVLGAIDALVFAYLRSGRITRADVPRVATELVTIVLGGVRP